MANGFIEKVAEQICDKHSRKLITAELESHLLDKIDYYVDIGYSKEDAEKRATEEMGNPDDTAVPLNALHQNKYRGVFTFICLVAVTALFYDNCKRITAILLCCRIFKLDALRNV